MAVNDAKTCLHPVYTVSNIQTHVPILDGTKVTYFPWAILFKLHARGYRVLPHIDGTDLRAKTLAEYDQWAEIDAIVLQWIYRTLSHDLLVRILEPDSTAFQAWEKIKHIFFNNKGDDIGTAFETQTMPPLKHHDQWLMDSGAGAHVTGDSGKLAHFSNDSHIKSVRVANGEICPVMGTGEITLTTQPKPLLLNKVLYTPKIVCNLVSIRQFTKDNNVSVEFDPSGFSVKDLQTGMILSRHDSKSNVYPFTSSSSTSLTKFTKTKDPLMLEIGMRVSPFITWFLRIINLR